MVEPDTAIGHCEDQENQDKMHCIQTTSAHYVGLVVDKRQQGRSKISIKCWDGFLVLLLLGSRTHVLVEGAIRYLEAPDRTQAHREDGDEKYSDQNAHEDGWRESLKVSQLGSRGDTNFDCLTG